MPSPFRCEVYRVMIENLLLDFRGMPVYFPRSYCLRILFFTDFVVIIENALNLSFSPDSISLITYIHSLGKSDSIRRVLLCRHYQLTFYTVIKRRC